MIDLIKNKYFLLTLKANYSNNTALLIEGTRRIGKSTIVKSLQKRNIKHKILLTGLMIIKLKINFQLISLKMKNINNRFLLASKLFTFKHLALLTLYFQFKN